MSIEDDILALSSRIKADPAPDPANSDPVESVWSALTQQESGGRQFDDSGKPIRSKAGAIGKAQIMEATGPEAAKMAGMEWDRDRWMNDEGYNEALGKAYLTHLYGRYGDINKALAAYNGGMGRVDQAAKRAAAMGDAGEWLNFMPAETRNYVPSILSRVGGSRPKQASARTSYDYAMPDAPIPKASFGEQAKDSAIALGAGVVGGVKMLTDLGGADNSVSRALADVQQAIQDGTSAERKAEMASDQQRSREAELYGTGTDEFNAGVKTFLNAPLDMTLGAIGSSAPTLLTLAIPGANATVATRLVAAGAMGGAQGVGVAKGSIYDGVLDGLKSAGIDQDTAEKAAAGAQAYDGEHGGMIAANGLMGIVATLTGADKSLAKAMSRKIADRAVELAVKKSAIKTVAGTAAKEMAGEGSQAALEKITTNKAVAGVGEEFGIQEMAATSPMQGVAGAMTVEALASGGMGVGGGILDVRHDRLSTVRQKADEGGALSKAAIAGQPATPPPQEDPLRARIDALKASGPATLQGLRDSNNPLTAQDWLGAMAAAENPSTPAKMREEAIAQMEAYAAHAQSAVVPGMVRSKSRELRPQGSQATGSSSTEGGPPPNAPAVNGPLTLPDPSVIDAAPSQWQAGADAPAGKPEQATANEPTPPVAQPPAAPIAATRVPAPNVSIPAGTGPAFLRKKQAQFGALAQQGFETVVKQDGAFQMVNSQTGQFFPLESVADVALARKAIADKASAPAPKAGVAADANGKTVYPDGSFGGNNDIGSNNQGNRGADSGVAPNESQYPGGGFGGRNEGELQARPGTDEPRGDSQNDTEARAIDALNAQQRAAGRDSFSSTPEQSAVSVATNAFLDVLAKVTGKRGIAVKNVRRKAFDGVSYRGDFFVNVDKPQMAIPSTIAHEFKHLNEDFPSLNKLYNRMFDRIPESARREYARVVGDFDYDARTPSQVEWLKSEMTADFMGQRFTDKKWLRRLAKEKPNLFAEFVEDWVKLLNSLIGELKSMLGVGVKFTHTKEIDGLMRDHLQQLEEMKSIAIEVAAEWAQQNPGLAKKSGVDAMLSERAANAYVAFEVAPDPNDEALHAWWNSLSPEDKSSVSARVAEVLVPRVLSMVGADGSVSQQVGSYLDDTNPSFALTMTFGDLNEVAKALGFVLSQDSMMAIATDPFSGGQKVGAVVVSVGDKSAEQIAAIYKTLRSSIPEVGGQSFANGRMTILNYSDMPTERMAEMVDRYTNAEYNVSVEDVYSSFPEKKDYDYANRENDTGSAGSVESRIRQGLNRLRGEATQAILAEKDARGPKFSGRKDQDDLNGILSKSKIEQGRDRPKKTERGFYGEPQAGSVAVTGYHFSPQPQQTLGSDLYGSGLKGAERERLNEPKNKDIKPRIFFYVSRGNKLNPESGVGGVIHKLTMRNLYDVTEDGLGIVASARGQGLNEADKSSAWERAVMKAGFDGYVTKDPIQPQWSAVLVGRHSVQPSLDPVQVAEAAERSKPKSKTRREGNELVATPDNQDLSPLVKAKPTIIEVAPSFRFERGAARVLESEAEMANAVIESQDIKFRFSTREQDIESAPKSNAKEVTANLLSDNYKQLDGVDVKVDVPTQSGSKVSVTVDAKAALDQIAKRQEALEMVLHCLI